MTTSGFIRITQRIIDRDGFDGYLPTLLLPARKHIEVLEGVPPEVNIEEAARDWADRTAEASEDFFLAFKLSAPNKIVGTG